MSAPDAAYTTVVFLPTPAGISDLASFSFHVPRLAFWAKLTVRARTHSAIVPTTFRIFMKSPVGIRIDACVNWDYSPVSALYCGFVRGTTDNRPILTSGDSANSLLALICSSETGRASAVPTLIFTTGFLGSAASTETTDAVPTARLLPPVL